LKESIVDNRASELTPEEMEAMVENWKSIEDDPK